MGIVGGIIGAVGNIGSALIGSDATTTAANDQLQAAQQASATELAMFEQTQANEAPYMAAGGNALQALMYGMGLSGAPGTPNAGYGAPPPGYASPMGYPTGAYGGGGYGSPMTVGGPYGNDLAYPTIGPQAYGNNVLTGRSLTGYPMPPASATGAPAPSGAPPGASGTPYAGNIGFGSLTAPFTAAQFQASPGYQYQVQQMMQAVQNSAAARGGVVSGNTLQALQQNAMGLANQDFYNAQNAFYGRENQLFNMLQTLAGSGQNAAANLGALGSNVAGQIGANTIGAGNSASAAAIANGQIWGNMFNGLMNNQSFMNGVNSMFGGNNNPDWQAMYDASNAGDWSVTGL